MVRAIVVAVLLMGCGGADPGAVPTEERIAEFCEGYCACEWAVWPESAVCTPPGNTDEQCRAEAEASCITGSCPNLFDVCVNSQLDEVERCVDDLAVCNQSGVNSCFDG